MQEAAPAVEACSTNALASQIRLHPSHAILEKMTLTYVEEMERYMEKL